MIVLAVSHAERSVVRRRQSLQGIGAAFAVPDVGGSNGIFSQLFTHVGERGRSASASAIHRLIESASRLAQ